MSKKLKNKVIILIAVVVLGTICMAVCISGMQDKLMLRNYTQEMEQLADQIPQLLEQADEETSQNTVSYDSIYQSKAESVSFMAANNAGYETTDSKMNELATLLDVDNIMIVNTSNQVVAKAEDTKANFASSRFNRLRTVFSSSEPSEAVEVDLASEHWHARYYSARIDDSTMVVIEQNPEELEQLVEDSGSTAAVLKNLTVGQTGYVFAVSSQDYLIKYHPNSELVGADAIEAGIDATMLEDGTTCWAKLKGQSLYCRVSAIGDMYYISAVPEADLASARSVTTGVVLFVFLVVMAIAVLYGICVLNDDERKKDSDKDFADLGRVKMNKTIVKKGAIISLVGFVAIVAISFYMQTLFSLSAQSVTNNDTVANLSATIKTADERADALREQYNERYLGKCKVAAYILDANPALANKSDLKKLADVLQVQYVHTYDSQGTLVATNSSLTNFTISTDPKDQSYAFRKLLQGVDHVIQSAQVDDVAGEMRQYIGVILHDADGNASGFVQLGIRPSRLQNLLDSVQIDKVLDGVKGQSGQFAFAINKSDGTFSYFPDSNLVGKTAISCGMKDNQLKDGFCDYLTIDGKTYYASSVEQGNYYLYMAGSEGELMSTRGPLTLAAAGISFVCLALLFVILIFERKTISFDFVQEQGGVAGAGGAADAGGVAGEAAGGQAGGEDGGVVCIPAGVDMAGAAVTVSGATMGAAEAAGAAGAMGTARAIPTIEGISADSAQANSASSQAIDPNPRKFDTSMPDGRKVRTESAASRWLGRSFKWDEKDPEQKVAFVVKIFGAIAVFAIFIAVLFRDQIFGSGSLFAYILDGGWEHGPNIFAFTACIMFACFAITTAMIVQKLMSLLAGVLESRGETVCRLLGSFIKYVTIIGTVYYCLALIGIDTTTLLASAGILSIAISLGAKELVSDILSGLFIIFEGEFRVGDIITVGTWSGTVVEIGVRTTKVMDGSQNIKVIRNSNVSDIVNMTKQSSYTWVDVGIEYSESIERVESILAKELPNIREHIPELIGGPFYKGVVSLGDSSVNIRIMVQCLEKDRGSVERALNREIKLLFDHYDIGIPYPQIVVNQAQDKKAATYSERMSAEQFNREQREASEAAEIADADRDGNE